MLLSNSLKCVISHVPLLFPTVGQACLTIQRMKAFEKRRKRSFGNSHYFQVVFGAAARTSFDETLPHTTVRGAMIPQAQRRGMQVIAWTLDIERPGRFSHRP